MYFVGENHYQQCKIFYQHHWNLLSCKTEDKNKSQVKEQQQKNILQKSTEKNFVS